LNMKPSGDAKNISMKIAVLFIVSGVLSLMFSILYESQVQAFLGLGLIFWGALFSLSSPVRYVQGNILLSTALSEYSTIDRILRQIKATGTSYHLPPYPQNVYLPEHLKGLKDLVVFVSSRKDNELPLIDDIAKAKFMVQNSMGVLLTPPGLGLLNLIEKSLNREFSNKNLNEVCGALPELILGQMSLAKEMEIKLDKNRVYLKILDSVYKGLYDNHKNIMSVTYLGCPIVSAIACAFAKATGKPVSLEKLQASPDGFSVEVWYRINI
jgi:hypothetical protein